MIASRMGRPPLPVEDRRRVRIRVYATPEEWRRMQQAAARSGASVSEWLRALALARLADDGR